MQGDREIVQLLNEQLTAELTAINQYFLHAKLQEHRGYIKLAHHTREESMDEMRHAEKLADRIIFLEGLPNFQRINPLEIGQTVTEMLTADLHVELDAVKRLRAGVAVMRSKGDIVSADLFEDILSDEEDHVDYLETQLHLLGELGEALYIAQLVEQPHD